jgi:uncharacterized protein (UPF0333 family)
MIKMKRRGQITLETAVLILFAINIFVYVTIPASKVSRAASESISTSALAESAAAALAGNANMVGLGGDGAFKAVSLRMPRGFQQITCSPSHIITVHFAAPDYTYLYDQEGLGVRAEVNVNTGATASAVSDYPLSCQLRAPGGNDTAACVCLRNSRGVVFINSTLERTGECRCS